MKRGLKNLQTCTEGILVCDTGRSGDRGRKKKTEEICISNQTRASGSLSLLRKGRERGRDVEFNNTESKV